jgi:hypothetical protein
MKTQITSHNENFINFYKLLVKNKALIEEADLTKSKLKGFSKPKTYNTLESVVSLILNDKRKMLISWPIRQTPPDIIVEFDSTVIKFSENKSMVLEKLKNLTIKNDWTVVEHVNGKIHFFFTFFQDIPLLERSSVNLLTRCLIPGFSYFAGTTPIMGPNAESKIWNVSKNHYQSLPMLPNYFLPIAPTPLKCRKFIEKLGDYNPLAYWKDDLRIKGLIAIIKQTEIEESEIKIYNNLFLTPTLSDDELKTEILNKRDFFLKKQQDFKNIFEQGVVYELSTNRVFLFSEKNCYWEKSDIFVVQKLLTDRGLELRGIQLELFIKTHLSVISLDKVRLEWEKTLPNNVFPIYFKNKAILLIKTETSFIIEDLLMENVRENLIYNYIDFDYIPVPFKDLDPTKSSLLEDVQQNCPEFYDFFVNLTTYKNVEFRKEIADTLLSFLACTFYKNFKDYNKQIEIQRIFIFSGIGGTSKSALESLFRYFVNLNGKATSELTHVNQRFESASFKDKILIQFSDEEGSRSGRTESTLRRFSGGFLKKLSGSDEIRMETKYGPVQSARNYGFVMLSTNDPVPVTAIMHYTAIKRRLFVVNMNRFIPIALRKINFIENLLTKEGASLAVIFALHFEKTNLFLKKLNEYDIELLILKYNEARSFEKEVCTYLSFIYHCFKFDKQTTTINLRFPELLAIYIQYLLFRPGSRISIIDYDLIFEIVDHCYSKAAIDHIYVKKILEKDFPVKENVVALLQSNESTFVEILDSRLEFLRGQKLFENSQLCDFKEQQKNSLGQIIYKKYRVNIFPNIQLNYEFLRTLPNIKLPLK